MLWRVCVCGLSVWFVCLLACVLESTKETLGVCVRAGGGGGRSPPTQTPCYSDRAPARPHVYLLRAVQVLDRFSHPRMRCSRRSRRWAGGLLSFRYLTPRTLMGEFMQPSWHKGNLLHCHLARYAKQSGEVPIYICFLIYFSWTEE